MGRRRSEQCKVLLNILRDCRIIHGSLQTLRDPSRDVLPTYSLVLYGCISARTQPDRHRREPCISPPGKNAWMVSAVQRSAANGARRCERQPSPHPRWRYLVQLSSVAPAADVMRTTAVVRWSTAVASAMHGVIWDRWIAISSPSRPTLVELSRWPVDGPSI